MTEAAFDLLDGKSYVTDGGMETDFIFRRGVDLPEFAAFPLLDSGTGRQLLSDYYADYASIASSAASGLMLESPTWRANLDWGRRLGFDEMGLARVNRAAVALLRDLAQRWADAVPTILVSGMIGPRGDGYQAEASMGAQESADYHRHRSTPCPAPISSPHTRSPTPGRPPASRWRPVRPVFRRRSPSPWRPMGGCLTARR